MKQTISVIKKLSRSLTLLLATFAMATPSVYAQGEPETPAAPDINIGGDVYGGGKIGSVGIGNLAEGIAVDADENEVKLTNEAAVAIETQSTTDVKIYDGKIRTVFAGGRNGRAFGTTSATIYGGTIGGEEWDGTTHGGVFGAGDGASALVFGCGRVIVENGTVWNNVYGGGNQAKLFGNTLVTLQGGHLYGYVFGGARMADIVSYGHVLIDGAHQKNDLYVKGVFGGSDIAGSVFLDMTTMQTNVGNGYWNWFMTMSQYSGKAMKPSPDKPEWLPDTKGTPTLFAPDPRPNRAINVRDIWNTVVESTPRTDTEKNLFVGNTFGSGNGDYDYVKIGGATSGDLTLPFHKTEVDGKWVADDTYKEDADGNVIPSTAPEYATATSSKTFKNLMAPNVERSYLQLEGGTYGYVYGGGNKATTNTSVDIYINNAEDPCIVPKDEVKRMGIQTTSFNWATIGEGGAITKVDKEADATIATFDQTFDRIFGGNNLENMLVAPNWYLIQGRVNNLYSGGNKGNMYADNGLLVNVFKNDGPNDKDPVTGEPYPADAMRINNIYGGCRMADVNPRAIPVGYKGENKKFGYEFLEGYSSRVYISGGFINNVYGGNDVSGMVYHGTDVEIHGAISGDVYGGGNGAYRYTDNKELCEKYPDEWSDYFYDADGNGATFNKEGEITNTEVTDPTASLTGLNKKRPHVASTLVHIVGEGQYLPKDKSQWVHLVKWLNPPTAADLSDVKSAVKVAYTPTAETYKIGGVDYNVWQEVPGTAVGMVLTRGEMADINRVYVAGGVYCGGNSASVTSVNGEAAKSTLQIGQCVTIDKVFLGSNGERMVDEDLLSDYAKGITYDVGAVAYHRAVGTESEIYKLAKFDLTQQIQFDEYMKGVDMNIMPEITYDNPDNKYTAANISEYSSRGKDVTGAVVGQEIDVSVDDDADMDPEGLNFSTRIGSFFVGGNVGSVTVEGTIGEATGLRFPRELVIFNKVVGGCNAANVPYREGINAFHLGGVIGAPWSQTEYQSRCTTAGVATPVSAAGENDPGLKIQLYVPCRFEPRYIVTEKDEAGFVHVKRKDALNNDIEPEPWSAPTVISDYGIESDKKGTAQILDRGNIYGGCYTSGVVNGSVQIDIKDELCATPQMRAYFGDKPLLGQQAGQDGTAAVVDNMRRYVLNHGWSAFGGGYGKDTEIWGNVYMNMSRNAGYINAYGGSQLGFIGKMQRHTSVGTQYVVKRTYNSETGRYDYTKVSKAVVPGDYITEVTTTTTTTTTTTNFSVDSIDVKIDKYLVDATGGTKGGSTYMNLRHDIHRSPVSIFGLNALYGGGYQGIVTGNTHMYAGGGLHYDVFGGASNADIYGYAETFVGIDREGNFSNNLQLRHCVYGGNDFGGQILGQGTHTVKVNGVDKELTSNTYVKYLGGTIERSLFGGSCGLYDYDGTYKWTSDDESKTPGIIMLGDVEYNPEPGDVIPLYPHDIDQIKWEDYSERLNVYELKGKLKESWETMPTLYNDIRHRPSFAENTYNTVVDIACHTDLATDMNRGIMGNTILGDIYGGGYGFCDAIGRVDAHDSYVVLAGPETGTNRLADNVFGGGYFSYVQNSTLEAVSGRVRNLYGGTYGTTVDEAVAYILREDKKEKAKTQTSTWGSEFDPEEYSVLSEFEKTQLKVADYTSQSTLVNVYRTMTANSAVNVYGAGAYTGSDRTVVNMLGGIVNEVYGGSNQEGVCKSVKVNVPATSYASMAAIFGGAHGSYKALPCDVKDATINFLSSTAVVRNGNIYGGNNAYRATRNTIINYDSQAKDKSDGTGKYLTIYGAGYGEFTVAGNTQVNISGTSIVQDLFGGGREGSVFAKYDIVKDPGDPPSTYLHIPVDNRTKETSKEDSIKYKNEFDAATNYHDASAYKRYSVHTATHDATTYAHWYETTLPHHTWVNLSEGAQVKGSVCGAGYGSRSVVAGNTLVDCNGAIISGDIFGGGYNGNVRKMVAHDTGYKLHDYEGFKTQIETEFVQDTGDNLYYENKDAKDAYTVSTTINMNGGTVRNIFGGGYAGVIGGEFEESADTVKCKTVTTAAYDMTATTNVNIGSEHGKLVDDTAGKHPGDDGYVTTYSSTIDHSYGIPNVNFSVYGAGDRGAVYGEAITKMYNGYVGYDYRPYTAAELAAMTEAERSKITDTSSYYIPRLKSNDADKNNLMKEDGNLYGGGFGEDARVLQTDVTIFDGVIRNSLYGGGEMSAVGWGTIHLDETTNELELSEIQKSGSTFVEMYGGLVHADAFAGGRGYSYDNFGKMMFGTKYKTDGFVFGKTDINIFRGTIGDDETIKEANGSHGNVFGGGNLGYVYSGNGKPFSEDGFYYKVENVNAHTPVFVEDANGNKTLTEDVRVNIQVYGKATADVTIPYSVVYHTGFTVPTEIFDRMMRHLGTIKVGSETYNLADSDLTPAELQELHDRLIDSESRAREEFTFEDVGTFLAGDHIPNEALGTLKNVYASGEDNPWDDIEQSGITIRNAVFAGGNVSKGSDKVYAFANTVFGNATASIIDTYSRDLIDVGEDGLGGLYGDGNLTFVDGYRELNVTNYGTDYYALSGKLDFSKSEDVARYNQLTRRQQNFYTTKFTCKVETGIGGYKQGDVITNEDLEVLAETLHWPEDWNEPKWGEGSKHYYWETYFDRTAAIINEGRYLNTLQRADYCGLKGSRIVMKGAMDRALDEGESVDYTPYTINRVGELSLNQYNIGDNRHGSYVGFYNVVKYLGSMSSDKNFVTGLVDASAGIATSSIRETNSKKAEDVQPISIGINPSTGAATEPTTKKLYTSDGATIAGQETTNNTDEAYTFFEWKVANHDKNNRNNGTSPNKVALASGVYLELVSGLDNAGNKIYGPITGVVELDLLNVAPGEGGGFVYAKNHHGLPSFDESKSYASVLSDANYHLKTVRAYSYADNVAAPTAFNGVETSGNFVHSSKRIVDDCFPVSNSYVGAPGVATLADAAPAHYWYLRGDFYVYEQLVSAYTGNAATYSSELNLPLDLNGKQNATLRLLNVLPGLYADPTKVKYISEEQSDSLEIIFNAQTKLYGHNDPVSYWDWHNMTTVDRGKFVLNTYICTDSVQYKNSSDAFVPYYPGQAILPSVFESIKDNTAYDMQGNPIKETPESEDPLTIKDMFRITNEISNDKGYLLTLDLTNPGVWNDYYTLHTDGTKKLTTADYLALLATEKGKYIKGATFTCNTDGVYGQYVFSKGEYTSKGIYDIEEALEAGLTEEQKTARRSSLAKFEPAYIVADSCEITFNNDTEHAATYLKGYPMSLSEAKSITKISGKDGEVTHTAGAEDISALSQYVQPAYICISTIEVREKDFRYLNQLITETEYNGYVTGNVKYPDTETGKIVKDYFEPAYYCVGGEALNSDGGSWGGTYFKKDSVYQALDVCNVLHDDINTAKDEFQYFDFNYDALDLLVSNYEPYNIWDGNGDETKARDEAAVLTAMGEIETKLNNDVKYYDAIDGVAQQLYQKIYELDGTATYEGNQEFTYKDATDESLGSGHQKMINTNATLTTKQFDNLPNDRKYYVPIKLATDSATCVVRETFDLGGKMYNAGQTISMAEYTNFTDGNKAYIDILNYETASRISGDYYYCIQEYEIGAKDSYVTAKGSTAQFESPSITTVTHQSKIGIGDNTTVTGTEIARGSDVPLGSIIAKESFEGNVPNYQIPSDFSLTGTSPTEEVTLYVPVSADMDALMKDRYVTAIYEYQYSETNDGINYETFVEKHIINIRLKFMYGQPKIGPLTPPDLILPLENIAMRVPDIEEGAFPIIGAGWELFPTLSEANRHRNGSTYLNGQQPLFWYQNGFYIAYYAVTKQGRTYSVPVPISVANYQKLTDVINDANHMFIDHKECDRNPKIYISDGLFDQKKQTGAIEAKANINQLDALKTLFDLSNTGYGTVDGKLTDSDSKTILQNHGRAFTNCSNLDFIISNDIDQRDYKYTEKETVDGEEQDVERTQENPWTPIGDEHNCFSGTIHGNGHTISGLENSLFAYLCGDVYNLGVMGTFTGSGIADHGAGRAENCWIWTTAKPAESVENLGVKAVMGNDGAASNAAIVVNCYYPDVDKYLTGTAKPRTAEDFLNGRVAYDLNRFYLEARYRRGATPTSPTVGTVENNYIYRQPNGKIEGTISTDGFNTFIPTQYTLKYESDATDARFRSYFNKHKVGDVEVGNPLGYVEHLYEDGDFRFADGLKPKDADMREAGPNTWLPVYPDDYIFFGQKLTYKLYEQAHSLYPQAAAKSKTVLNSNKEVDNSQNGLLLTSDAETNRLYRAPAYFRNGVYGKSVVFNSAAAFRDNIKVGGPKSGTGGNTGVAAEYDEDVIPYDEIMSMGTYRPHHYMTAVDFTGGNGDLTGGYKPELDAHPYAPLLDFNGLSDIKVNGLTQNLLVYTPGDDVNGSGDVIADGVNTKTAKVVSDYFKDGAITETNGDYRTVGIYAGSTIVGHAVRKNGDEYVATTDHLLVDKQDFNAPISYNFAAEKRMWYQRTPNRYAEGAKGWSSVSIPFEAELVTTQQKGEITHFYQGSTRGHEYWLRGLGSGGALKEGSESIYSAVFDAPTAGSNGKLYKNTFLWDYYYQNGTMQRRDANEDLYQYDYYRENHTFNNYPYNEAGTPYIVGFPGQLYYEFDMSGNFVPADTYTPVPAKLNAQTVTFASVKAATIKKSDDELIVKTDGNNYTFVPCYLNDVEEAAGTTYYQMNSEGSAFDLVDKTADPAEALKTEAFRPYFTHATSSPAKPMVKSIVFGAGNGQMNDKESEDALNKRLSGMKIYVSGKNLVVESTDAADLNVNYINGAFVRRIHVNEGTNVYEGFRPGFYVVGRTKVYFRPGAY